MKGKQQLVTRLLLAGLCGCTQPAEWERLAAASSAGLWRAPSQGSTAIEPSREIPRQADAPAPGWGEAYGLTILPDQLALRAYLHPSLPPFRFVLRAKITQGANQERVAEDLRQIEVYGHTDLRPFQVLATTSPASEKAGEKAADKTPLPLEPSILQLTDIDFDGFLDLGLKTDHGAQNLFWRYWRFDPGGNRFEEVPALAHVSNPTFDRHTHLIQSHFKDGFAYWESETFEWQGSVARRVSKVEHNKDHAPFAETHWTWPAGGTPTRTVISLADYQPATEQGCRDWDACRAWGRCRSIAGRCVTSSEGCRASTACKVSGRCAEKDGMCVATQLGCEQSTQCADQGLCQAREPECHSTPEGIRRSTDCIVHGKCTSDEGDCRSTELCRNYGRCTLDQSTCVAAGEDCAQSQTCRLHGLCTAKNGWCE